ncbi:MAG: zinc-ribbon domain-containing protein [Eggerthellaceae bacterium]
MGFFDDIQGAVDRGMSSMERSVEIAKINVRLKEINQQRTNLAAQLGACLYERTKSDPTFTEGLETLYSGIARLDSERSEAQAMIEALQNQPQQKAPARQVVTCPTCGSFCDPTDMFCCGCGAKVADFASTAAVASVHRCPECSAPIEEDDAFCMNCGAHLAATQPQANIQDAPQSDSIIEPVVNLEPAPTPEQKPIPVPDSTIEPVVAPEPAPEPEPMPVPEPIPAPELASETVLTLDPAIAPIEPSTAPANDVVLTLEPTIAPVEPQSEPAPEPELNFVRTPDVEDDEDLELTLVMDPETVNETPVAPEPEPEFPAVPVPAPSLVVESFVVPHPETANGTSNEPNTITAPTAPEPAPAPQLTFEPLGDDSGIDLNATLQPFLPIDEKAEPAPQPQPGFQPIAPITQSRTEEQVSRPIFEPIAVPAPSSQNGFPAGAAFDPFASPMQQSSFASTPEPAFQPIVQPIAPASEPVFQPIAPTPEPAPQPVAPVPEPEPVPAPAQTVSRPIFDSPVIPPAPEPQPEPAPQTDSAAPQRRFCPNCGKVITPGDRFCMICGSNLDDVWQESGYDNCPTA